MAQEPRRLAMTQWDVFSSTPLEGNSLAVFSDARGLTDPEMQALAKEMNLSETTFIFPRDAATERAQGVRVRIFTVQEELPFAGHPTLGTAYVLHSLNGSAEVRLHLGVGIVPVRFEQVAGKPVFGEMTQNNPQFGTTHDPHALTAFTNLKAEDFDPSVPIQTVSTGLTFTITAVRSLEKLRNLELNVPRATEYLEKNGGKFFYFVCRETVDPDA